MLAPLDTGLATDAAGRPLGGRARAAPQPA